MFTTFFRLIPALLVAATLVSCQQGNEEIRDAARRDIEVVTPADPTAAAPAQPTVAEPTGPTTTMQFAEESFDFGSVDEGEIITHTYSFTNTGDEPLLISDARGSCGCTVPSRPTAPIAPGETGEITVRFDTRNKVGDRNQRVTITANTNPARSVISLNGTVVRPEAPAVQ